MQKFPHWCQPSNCWVYWDSWPYDRCYGNTEPHLSSSNPSTCWSGHTSSFLHHFSHPAGHVRYVYNWGEGENYQLHHHQPCHCHYIWTAGMLLVPLPPGYLLGSLLVQPKSTLPYLTTPFILLTLHLNTSPLPVSLHPTHTSTPSLSPAIDAWKPGQTRATFAQTKPDGDPSHRIQSHTSQPRSHGQTRLHHWSSQKHCQSPSVSRTTITDSSVLGDPP